MSAILVVEDESSLRESVRISLSRRNHQVATAATLDQATKVMHDNADIELVISDLRLPDGSGLDVLARAKDHPLHPATIMISAYGSVDTAVEAMKLGAFDFLSKPFGPDDLTGCVERALANRIRLGSPTHLSADEAMARLVGHSAAIQNVREHIRQAARARAVVISGETGTGKDLVARAIHARRNLRSPFVVVHCGALPDSSIESVLFGDPRRDEVQGTLAEADGGTIYLDGVDELSATLQTRLLHFLEANELHNERGVEGSSQVVSATNRNLADEVNAGRFRSDLLHRLDLVRIQTPALREHLEDLPAICAALLQRLTKRMRHDLVSLSASGLDHLRAHSWPGNVRELEHTLERALLASSESVLSADVIAESLGGAAAIDVRPQGPKALPRYSDVRSLDDVEREHILRTLKAYGGDRSKTARALGIARSTLRRKLMSYDV